MNQVDPLTIIDRVFKDLTEKRPAASEPVIREFGTVLSVGNGIAGVTGLPGAMADEVVEFSNGQKGLVYNLDPDEIGILILGEGGSVEAGEEVSRTGRTLGIRVGSDLIGRVIDPLGIPIDGGDRLIAGEYRSTDTPVPELMMRESVNRPLQTGIKIIDAMIPIGKGQRELILGDRQTGKTSIALSAIMNQDGKDVICIYCGIGKRKAEISRVISQLRSSGALRYSVVLAATGGDAPGLQYIAPYTAMSVAEYFMYKGKDVLLVLDDLTWHARAYRELALLLRRPPGREAYPGDIFHIHARLLERSCQLSRSAGGGSITTLPIVETQSGDISSYIPTNLISITDGQIVMSSDLFQKDMLPAIDAGRSVSRVGGAAQLPAYQKVSKRLRVFYSQYEELESFSRFSSRLDEDTRSQLESGRRIREALKQDEFVLMDAAEQIMVLYAAAESMLREVSLENIAEVLEVLVDSENPKLSEWKKKLSSGEALSDVLMEELGSYIEEEIRDFTERHPEKTIRHMIP